MSFRGPPYAFDARNNDILKPLCPFFSHFPYSVVPYSLSVCLAVFLSLFLSKTNKIVGTEEMRVYERTGFFLLLLFPSHSTYVTVCIFYGLLHGMEWNEMKWNHIDFYFLQNQPAWLLARQLASVYACVCCVCLFRLNLDWTICMSLGVFVWLCVILRSFFKHNLFKFFLKCGTIT